MTYSIPVANGDYQVFLKMAEIQFNEIGSRVFDVSIEGTQVISGIDLYAVAGHDLTHDRTFSTTVNDGVLAIELAGRK